MPPGPSHVRLGSVSENMFGTILTATGTMQQRSLAVGPAGRNVVALAAAVTNVPHAQTTAARRAVLPALITPQTTAAKWYAAGTSARRW